MADLEKLAEGMVDGVVSLKEKIDRFSAVLHDHLCDCQREGLLEDEEFCPRCVAEDRDIHSQIPAEAYDREKDRKLEEDNG